MLDQAIEWVLEAVRDTLNLVWKLVASTLFHLPDVTALPQVQALAARALVVVNTTYVLAIAAAGVAVMMHGSVQIRYGAGELLPRLVIGLAAANFATVICVAIIDTANALVMALTGQGIASTGAANQLLQVSNQLLTDPVAALLVAVIGLILVVLVVLLMVGWIIRFIVLVVLCGIAPLALACHGTPWTDGAARLWWQVMGGVCVTVVLQALALNTSLAILLSPGANLATFGMPGDPGGLLNLLIVVVLLWMTVRIPSLVRRYLTQTGNRQNLFGALVRLVIAQQVTRGVGTALRAGSTALRARAGAGAPRGVHRGGARHATGRTTGDPLRAFTPDPPREPIEDQVIPYWRPRERPDTPTGRTTRAGRTGRHRAATEDSPGPSRPSMGRHRAPAGDSSTTPSGKATRDGGAGRRRARPVIPEGVNPATVFGNGPRSPHLTAPAASGSSARPGTPRHRAPTPETPPAPTPRRGSGARGPTRANDSSARRRRPPSDRRNP